MSELSRWQRREDGMPTDEYFAAVEAAVEKRGIVLEDSSREEDWEYNLELAPESYRAGPLAWVTHGLYVSWRVAEMSEPQHAEDFGQLHGDIGWYWVPYTSRDALGDFSKPLDLPYLAEPDEVAAAIHTLITPTNS